jgi:light-regulated signal transduction histidine kinase (bacteriophytochrome)/CheY-like chemotaxis protein
MTQSESIVSYDFGAFTSNPGENAGRQAQGIADSDEVSPELTPCDVEPITRLERIQSFGFLLALSRDWIITRVSANLEEMLGIDPRIALGDPLDSWVDGESLHSIRNRMSGLSLTGGVERMYGVVLVKGRAPLDIAVHYAGDLIVLEGELAGLDSRMDAASLVRKMIARLNTQPSLDAFHRDAARQVRALTGFDRTMIYRFSTDGAGEVIAEVAKADMESFLGLHYPASDIPVQARALYLKNSFRIIADVAAPTIPLISAGVDAAEPLDLSLAVTRAVSAVHIEYLRNMGVSASLSISIIVEGRLWGLVACHNDTARLPTFVTRTAAELFGQMYSMTLESRLRVSADSHERRGRESVGRMVKAIASNDALLSDAGWLQDTMAEMISCDGVVVVADHVVSASGATPPSAHIAALVQLLNTTAPTEVFVIDRLAALGAEFAEHTGVAAGVLCIPISSLPGDYVMLYRREHTRDLRWAGASSKSAGLAGMPERLSPRTSFAAFSESVHGQSRPFTEGELRIAEAIRSGLIEVLWRGSHEPPAERGQVSGRQELLIAELNHRVRNVLALIRGLIRQTHGEGGDSASYVASLNGRVQALARAHDRVTAQNWGPGALNAIFDDEIAAYVPNRRDRFTINGPSVMLQPKAYSAVALVVHELVTNSSKYGALCDSGRVEVTLTFKVGEGLLFRWCEIDGPTVRVPTRRGFGSVIIERVVPFDLQGTASVSYLPSGLEAEFLIPERHLAPAELVMEQGPEIPSTAVGNAPESILQTRPLLGSSVLLLEDNLIVALEAEDLLRTLGASSIVAVSTVSAAASTCESTSIDFAVLDINLGIENSLEFAAFLRSAGIPFVFTSGYGEQDASGDSRASQLTVAKPYDLESLRNAIAQTLARSSPESESPKGYQ